MNTPVTTAHAPGSARIDGQPLELWGGVECTVNRVGDRYFEQLSRSGHAASQNDIDRFARIGFAALRFPILWEKTVRDAGRCDWGWAEPRLCRMRELDLRPIAGLIHHGSGPPSTNLLDPSFASRLADYARQVAEHFPWIEDYTPVNEPLTTARFSALYGHWYPHASDPLSFARALLHQIKGVALAMRAIREVNPKARLVQTEDLGKVHSTPLLSYQAEFENCRRWLTFDLLLGRVDASHPMWSYFLSVGVKGQELDWFLENTCPPGLLGLNYYVVGERLLDERCHRYPDHVVNRNGQHTYADVAAVRVLKPGITGAEGVLAEAWERYAIPMAVTEAHMGCTREEQLRWVIEIWRGAKTLRDRGAEVRAVTLWALLGAFDWNCLLTRADGYYESGVFDVRARQPRATALASLAMSLSKRGDFHHPVLATPGWWRRDQRLLYPETEAAQAPAPPPYFPRSSERPVLITGGGGTLARAFARLCELRGLAYQLLDRQQLDISQRASIERALRRFAPWAVVNAAGFVRVDDAELEAERCWVENVIGAETLARECGRQGMSLVTFSSDLVFNGRTSKPYDETAAPDPLNQYGRSKSEADIRVRSVHPTALVIRTSAFFGPWDEANFITAALRALAAGHEFAAANDEIVSPTYVPDLVHASLDLLIDGETGVWHLANKGAVTWAELAAAAAGMSGIDVTKVRACPGADLHRPASRPAFAALTSCRASIMRPWEEALDCYMQDRKIPISTRAPARRNFGKAAALTRAA